jgi:hypothetical protein
MRMPAPQCRWLIESFTLAPNDVYDTTIRQGPGELWREI